MNVSFASFYQGKRVLLTGHTGFKGSWLTEWLLMMGANVTGLALPPPTEPALFNQLGLEGRCDHRIGDIRDLTLVNRIVREVKPDLVFHLAAQPLVRRSYEHPIETYETNVIGTANVLETLRNTRWPCAAVMVTTDKVYENREWVHAYRESDPLGGYDPYSSSKACAELVIQSYRQSYFNPADIQKEHNRTTRGANNVPLVAVASARAGNVIGGGDWAKDRIVPDCMRALAEGKVITVRNPQATRPWQHVLEPLSGYLLLGMRLFEVLDSPSASPPPTTRPSSSAPSALCSAFNFGPDPSSHHPVRDLVEEVVKHWPGRWEDCFDPSSPHEAGLLHLSTDKAAHELGWHPRWSFAQTVHATVSWYRAIHERGEDAATSLVHDQIRSYAV